MSSLGEAIVIVYLVGATVVGSVAFGGALVHGRTELKTATILGIGAGAAWPLVILGVVQWLSIAAIIDAARCVARVRPGQRLGDTCRPEFALLNSIGHSDVDLPRVDEMRSAQPTRLIGASPQANWRIGAQHTTDSRQEPAQPVHTCAAVAPVELPGWGITFGPVLVARLRRPTAPHVHTRDQIRCQ